MPTTLYTFIERPEDSASALSRGQGVPKEQPPAVQQQPPEVPPPPPGMQRQFSGHLMLLDIESSSSGQLLTPTPPGSPCASASRASAGSGGQQQTSSSGERAAASRAAATFTPPSNYVERANRTLFFARVSSIATNEEVAQAFETCGEVEEVNVFRAWPTAKASKGCGLVVMATAEGAAKAIDSLDKRLAWEGADGPMVVERCDPARLGVKAANAAACKAVRAAAAAVNAGVRRGSKAAAVANVTVVPARQAAPAPQAQHKPLASPPHASQAQRPAPPPATQAQGSIYVVSSIAPDARVPSTRACSEPLAAYTLGDASLAPPRLAGAPSLPGKARGSSGPLFAGAAAAPAGPCAGGAHIAGGVGPTVYFPTTSFEGSSGGLHPQQLVEIVDASREVSGALHVQPVASAPLEYVSYDLVDVQPLVVSQPAGSPYWTGSDWVHLDTGSRPQAGPCPSGFSTAPAGHAVFATDLSSPLSDPGLRACESAPQMLLQQQQQELQLLMLQQQQQLYMAPAPALQPQQVQYQQSPPPQRVPNGMMLPPVQQQQQLVIAITQQDLMVVSAHAPTLEVLSGATLSVEAGVVEGASLPAGQQQLFLVISGAPPQLQSASQLLSRLFGSSGAR